MFKLFSWQLCDGSSFFGNSYFFSICSLPGSLNFRPAQLCIWSKMHKDYCAYFWCSFCAQCLSLQIFPNPRCLSRPKLQSMLPQLRETLGLCFSSSSQQNTLESASILKSAVAAWVPLSPLCSLLLRDYSPPLPIVLHMKTVISYISPSFILFMAGRPLKLWLFGLKSVFMYFWIGYSFM